ncbi:MAG: hypothetical protein Q8M94_02090 [Ignavibacteria bacterium]|nr:hypothetical protein [Ignavibacteria bacterium]
MEKKGKELKIDCISLVQNPEKSQLFNSERITFKLPVSVKIQFLRLAGEKCFNASQILRVAVLNFIKENQ